MNNGAIFHRKFCKEFRVFPCLCHINFNFLLLINLRNRIPGSLGTIIIICHKISFKDFPIHIHAFNRIPYLILNTKCQGIAFLNPTRSFYDTAAGLRIERIRYLVSVKILQCL